MLPAVSLHSPTAFRHRTTCGRGDQGGWKRQRGQLEIHKCGDTCTCMSWGPGYSNTEEVPEMCVNRGGNTALVHARTLLYLSGTAVQHRENLAFCS